MIAIHISHNISEDLLTTRLSNQSHRWRL